MNRVVWHWDQLITPISEDYKAGEESKFTRKVAKVTVELKPAKALHRADTDQIEANKAAEEQSVQLGITYSEAPAT